MKGLNEMPQNYNRYMLVKALQAITIQQLRDEKLIDDRFFNQQKAGELSQLRERNT